MGCSVAGTSPSAASPTWSCSNAKLARTGSTGKNASGFRHQFSNSANIELSIESITHEAFQEIVGTPIDFHQDGYLFLLSKSATVETFKKNVALQQKHGVDVRFVSNDEARELSPGLDLTGVKAATYCPSDGVTDPNGVTMGFARGAQAPGIGSRVRRAERIGTQRCHRCALDAGRLAPIFINAAGPGPSRSAATLASTCWLNRNAATSSSRSPRGGSWDDASMPQCAEVEDPGQFREHVLLSSRRR